MKETFITRVPDRAGIFLDISQVIAGCGGSIIRINYNKGVDENTVFIEVSAEKEQLLSIREQLTQKGYLSADRSKEYQKVVLCDLTLPDGVGVILPVLEAIKDCHVNISFVNYQREKKTNQHVRLGLHLDDPHVEDVLLARMADLCKVRILDYEVTDRSLDSSVFYATFAEEIRDILHLSVKDTESILVYSNEIMQMLDEGNQAHLKTFDYIRRFASFIASHKGEAFLPRVTRYQLRPDVGLTSIEPPCGSTVYILSYQDELLFVDCGFACFREEMLSLLEKLFPGFTERPKCLAITHADTDHTGFLDLFDCTYLNQSCLYNFDLERKCQANYREQNSSHEPYSRICKIITGYHPPDVSRCIVVGAKHDEKLLSRVGEFTFGPFLFKMYEGLGGHVRGESVIACPELSLVFTGDIFINVHGLTDEQRDFNALAPYLMTRVDEDAALARTIRSLVVETYEGYHTICPGHGAVIQREVTE